jgi:hypothetical protein
MKKVKSFLLFCLTLLSFAATAQGSKVKLNGEIYDTLNRKGVEHAIVMAIRIKDSVLTSYTRSDWEGKFSLEIPRDTFQVLITSPKFEEREYYIFGNENTKDLDFGRIVLPEKGEQLKEYVVFSNNAPIYFNGDTLIMVADSFKTAANANVEDLFKKLPGFDVDKSGKIVVHGKEVSKVYVDGDEFFGTDPTVATKNLPAGAIENVQVYDQKVEGDNTDETEKVINLTLKEDAKRGMFGKINGATDFQNYYEGEALVNRFNGSQKISIFGLFTNTPRNDFNWRDSQKFGLSEEIGKRNEYGGYDFEPQIGNLGTGVPQKAKTGFYFTDKLGKNLEVGVNFTYDNQQVLAESETNSVFTLTDTSYSSYSKDSTFSTQEAFALNFNVEWKVDSSSTLTIQPRVKQILGSTDENSTTQFKTEENVNSRITNNNYNEQTDFVEASLAAKWRTEFKKANRSVELNYQIKQQQNSSKDFLINNDNDILNDITLLNTDQTKNGKAKNLNHYGDITYVEPLGKKLKIEGKYSIQYASGSSRKFAFDNINGEYDILNQQYSADFENLTINQRAGGRLIYTTKMQDIILGADVNNVSIESTDLLNDTTIDQNQLNILPFLKYKYKFSRSKNLSFTYKSVVRNPSVSQLQPLPDNRNLNNISVGNIDLKSQVSQSFELNYFTYKATTGSHSYLGANFSLLDDAFSQEIFYDAQGRSLSRAINVDGNKTFNAYIGGSIPLFKQKIKIDPFANVYANSNNSIINGLENETKNQGLFGQLKVRYILDSLELYVGGNYSYGTGNSSLYKTPQLNVYTALNGGIEFKLKHKIEIRSDVEQIISSQRADGFDITYTIWDASISKMFLEKENLIISFEAKDILNQNISNSRNIYNNVVVDNKTNIIGRYLLLRAVYKFNVLKKQKNEKDF